MAGRVAAFRADCGLEQRKRVSGELVAARKGKAAYAAFESARKRVSSEVVAARAHRAGWRHRTSMARWR